MHSSASDRRGGVIFSDISDAPLEQSRRAVAARDLPERARFVSTRAEHLAAIADRSVDVATIRSVLIYVADEPRAFGASHRVLRPGGRSRSLRAHQPAHVPREPSDRFWGYEVSLVADLADKVKRSSASSKARATTAMMDSAATVNAAMGNRARVARHAHG